MKYATEFTIPFGQMSSLHDDDARQKEGAKKRERERVKERVSDRALFCLYIEHIRQPEPRAPSHNVRLQSAPTEHRAYIYKHDL